MTAQSPAYKGWWPLLDELPKGWVFDSTAGSPLTGYRFVTNGKSMLKGQQRALLRVDVQREMVFAGAALCIAPSAPTEMPARPAKPQESFPARTVNDLARAKFKAKILWDIQADMMICEIEGWSKLEYIEELQSLITGLRTPRAELGREVQP